MSHKQVAYLRKTVCLLAAALLVALAAPAAFAVEIAPEPDAPLGDAAPIYATPLEGFAEIISVPLLAATQSDAAATADCLGCYARNRMYWTNYGAWESVGVDYSRNTASEVISRQNHHVALLNGQGGCYEGGYKYQNSTPQEYNRQNSAYDFHTGKYTAYNDRWTLASGHHWHEDGVHWSVDGGADICKKF